MPKYCTPIAGFVSIKGFEGLYEINLSGEVRRLPYGKTAIRVSIIKMGGIINSYINNFGYREVHLKNDENKTVRFLLHRLLAMTFIPNPNNYPVVNHKDGNKLNNAIENLEWCSYRHNNVHALENGLTRRAVGEKAPKAKLKEFEAIDILNKYKLGVKKCDLARLYKIEWQTVDALIRGKNWKHLKIS